MADLGTLWFDTKLKSTAVSDADRIKKDVLHKLGNSIPLNVKITFKNKDLRSDLQSKLSSFKPKVKVDIIVDQAAATSAVQQALAKAGLTNSMTAGQLRAQRAAEIQQRMALALARAQREAAAGANAHSKSLLSLTTHFGQGITLGGKLSQTMATIYNVYMLKNFVTQMIEIGGQFQKQRIALETMLGSMAKADAMYAKMKSLAVESPFTFMDLMSYTKQLKAFQIPYNELFETTKRLGDISAGLGVDMSRLILAYGQVRSAAVLRGQEVRQFTEAGIPLLDALAKKFSELENRAVSVGDVFDKISKRQVSFDMVKQVMWDLTDEGGQFYNMQEKLTESLSGKLDKLRDSYEIMVAEMAQGNNAVLGGMLDIMTKLVAYGDKFVGIITTLTGAYIVYKTAVMATNAVLKLNAAIEATQLVAARINAIRQIQGLTAKTWLQVAAQRALNVAMSANPWGLAFSAMTVLAGLYLTFSDRTKTAEERLRDLNAEMQNEIDNINETEKQGKKLIDTMFDESKTVDTQKEAYERLQALYPTMFENMDFEQAKRRSNIELLKMETEAARNAMKAKLNERIADAKERKIAAQKEYDATHPKSPRDKALSDAVLARGDKDAAEDFKNKARQAAKDYEAVSKELDELLSMQSDVENKIKTASTNRSSKWWNEANKLAKDFKQYAPKEDQDFEDYFEFIGKNLNSRKGFLDKMTKEAENYNVVDDEVKALEKIYTAIGGKTEALSKFKPKGGDKDPLLEQYKTRFDTLKNFRRDYLKYLKDFSEDDAISMTEDLFPEFKGKGKDIIKNFQNELNKLLQLPINGDDARQKFHTSVKSLMTDDFAAVVEKEASDALKKMQEYISKESEKYNIYKTILDKTGQKWFAGAAFVDGRVWDEVSKGFADTLREKMQEQLKEGGKIELNWDIDEVSAKKYFKDNFKNGESLYELWKKIVELTGKNYTDSLQKGADSYAELLTASQKVLKIEQELAELRKNGATPYEIEGKERELSKAKRDEYKSSTDYLDFYGAIYSMTLNEAETVGQKIRENLVEELKEGVISGEEYAKAIKRIGEQINKLKGNKGLTAAAITGGAEAVKKLKLDIADDNVTKASNQLKDSEDKLREANDKLREAIESLEQAESEEDRDQAQQNVNDAQEEVDFRKQRVETDQIQLKNAQKQQKVAEKSYVSFSKAQTAISGIAMAVAAMVQGYNDAKQAAASFGEDLDANMTSFGQHFMGILEGLNTGLSRAQNGDYMGAITGTVFGSISSIAQKHDATLKQDIEASQLLSKTFKNSTELLEKRLEGLMGSIDELKISSEDRKELYKYIGVTSPEEIKVIQDFLNGNFKMENSKDLMSALWNNMLGFKESLKDFKPKSDTEEAVIKAIQSESYYDFALADLLIQRDELKRQLAAQEEMKNKDEDAILDLKAEIASLEVDIEDFAKDMADKLYGINFKDWASQLAESLVSAWAAGESGAEAYKKKVSEILRDLAVKMITEKILLQKLNPIMDSFIEQYKTDGGVLTKEGMSIIAQMFDLAEDFEKQTNDFMDGLNEEAKKRGYDLKDNESSSSISSSIQGVTEQTADLLASYMNAIRADVSVNRAVIAQYLPVLSGLFERNNVIAETQVLHLSNIAINTQRNAEAAERIYDLLHAVAPDGTRIQIR